MPDLAPKTDCDVQTVIAANKRKFYLRLILTIISLLVISVLLWTSKLYWKTNQAIDVITSGSKAELPVTAPEPEVTYHADKPISIVLLGSDTREETGSLNTDVIIVAVVDPLTKKVTMLSIPRDTRVKIPGYSGYHKINAVYANGEVERRKAEAKGQPVTETGISLVKETFEGILGIPIQHFVKVDFQGFEKVVDELGGVKVNVERSLQYDDPTDHTHIRLEPGEQVLNGEQALGYVRHRHDNRGLKYYSNDFERNQRQQEVIKSIVDKMMSVEGLASIFDVIDAASQHVRTDLSAEQIKGLVFDMKGLRSTDLYSIESGAEWKPDINYNLIPEEKMAALRTALQQAMGVTPDPSWKPNNSSVEGKDEPIKKPVSKPAASTKGKTPKAPPAKPDKPAETTPPESGQRPPADPNQQSGTETGTPVTGQDQPPKDATTPGQNEQQPPPAALPAGGQGDSPTSESTNQPEQSSSEPPASDQKEKQSTDKADSAEQVPAADPKKEKEK